MTFLNQFHKEAMERTMRKIEESKKSPMSSKDFADYMRKNLEKAKAMEAASKEDATVPDLFAPFCFEFEPIPSEDADELMTYELTIPYKECTRFEEILHKISFPVSALKKVVNRAAIF